ncbi:hybrid sensor histidine kinase/response regulator [Nisaea nitritireducens]|uniref:hybrid sensor histidine kinase/response regulator n=1 Tax=Nisaea nitritireducens TaxID=568392 RepID=UPI001867573D|nr:ATP-binding protein [Nisaea nitritireducens]
MDPMIVPAVSGFVAAAAIAVTATIKLKRSREALSTLEAEREQLRGDVASLTAEVSDLTQAEKAEAAPPLPVCRFSEEGRFLSASQSFTELFGAGDGDNIASNKVVLRLRLMVSKHMEQVRAAEPGELVLAGTVPGEADQSAWQVQLAIDRDTDDAGSILALLLPQSDSWTAPALDYAPAGIVFLGPDFKTIHANAAYSALVEGTGPGAADRGTLFVDLIDGEDREAAARFLEAASADGENIEVQLVDREGGDGIEVAVFCRSLKAGEGPDGAILVVYLIDIGRRRQLEAQVAQSQKMQAVGQLAGGVAHDFNNLLTAMNGYCDLLLARHRPGDQSFSDVMQVKQNANRAANLVRQLLAFSRQQTMIARVLDVTETVADLSHLLRRLIGENITLKITHGRELAPIRVDQGQLEQVVINLVVNARDACPSGGMITMRTQDFVTQTPVRRGDDMMPVGRYVQLDVVDTGTGIDEKIIARIFEPFFSTKEVGQGTGLGLSTVYGIVKQINGFISVESTVGEGTTFSVFLPAYEGKEALSRHGEGQLDGTESRKDLTGVETIMLVEDEDPVRLFGARALRNKGYKVIEARNGEAALQLLSDKSEEIDLLITDVVMPGMDGPTLVRKVREDRPDLRVICISGYSEDALRQRIEEDTNIHFLPKPFSLKQLAGTVKDVLHPL